MVAQVLHSSAQHLTLHMIKMPASLLGMLGSDTLVLWVRSGVVMMCGVKT